MCAFRSVVCTFVSASIAALAMAQAPAWAQVYPTRPVHIITGAAPGSGIDVILRIIANRLTQLWGQQVLAVNHPGAGGSIATRKAAEAAPDGYTLYIPAFSTFVAPPGAAANLPIQVPRDFTPIGHFGGQPMLLTAASWLGVKTLPDLIALAKTRPGELAYGTNGPGRLSHLTGELLQSRTGIKLLMVPYSGGTAKILADVMGKRIPLVFDGYASLRSGIETGSLHPLAIAAPERSSALPDLPTASETIPGFAAAGWQVLVAPRGTPEPIVKKVNTDLIEAIRHPETRSRLARFDREMRALSPGETTAFIHAEQQKWMPILNQIRGR